MKDGHLNKCKACAKIDVRKRYALTREERASYERSRCMRPERIRQKIKYQALYRVRNIDKYRAHTAVSNAIRDGRLIRKSCEVCGDKAQGHHDDYSKPLEVRWLCFKHHRELAHGQTVSKK